MDIPMKRSEINASMLAADEFIHSRGFYLPPFAYWTPDTWEKKGTEVSEIVDNKLGWDITDFGRGDFNAFGLILFTVRNGNLHPGKTLKGKLYAEKIMVVGDGQVTPFHFHWSKMEDIINRGGGNLVMELFSSDEKEGISSQDIIVKVDGVLRTVPSGGKIILEPGESICLEQGVYHRFYGEPGKGKVFVGEVSEVNDDTSDNRFLEVVGRFPQIIEDEEPLHLLVLDYKKYL